MLPLSLKFSTYMAGALPSLKSSTYMAGTLPKIIFYLILVYVILQKLSTCFSKILSLIFHSNLINQIILKSGQMFIWQNEPAAVQSASVVDQAVVHGCEHVDVKVF